jgi:hypothetical protein
MKYAFLIFVLTLFSPVVYSQDITIINNFIKTLDSHTPATLSAQLLNDGYSEVKDPAFKDKSIRCFTIKNKGGDAQVYLMQYCANKVTGFYTSLSRMERVILTDDLRKNRFKRDKEIYNKYYYKDLTIGLVSDGSAESRAYYLYAARKNDCHKNEEAMTLSRPFNLQPYTLEDGLSNLGMSLNDVIVSMAHTAFFHTGIQKDVVTFTKGNQSYGMEFCEGKVKAYVLYQSKSTGNALELDIKKRGLKLAGEQTGRSNSFTRAYETDDYVLMLKYFGDVSEESERIYAYQLVVGKRKTPCEK